MNKPKMTYFAEEDVLHIVIAEGPESSSMEIAPNITAELNERNELIGVEILNASLFMRDAVLESVQAKLAHLVDMKPA
jgi:uncharacterized protein YuzE